MLLLLLFLYPTFINVYNLKKKNFNCPNLLVDYTVKQLQNKQNNRSTKILKSYVADGYRACEILEPFLKHPKCFSGQITFPISQSHKTLLVKK